MVALDANGFMQHRCARRLVLVDFGFFIGRQAWGLAVFFSGIKTGFVLFHGGSWRMRERACRVHGCHSKDLRGAE